VFGATMTSLSAEMSALATVTVVDIYQRHVRTDATDHHYQVARVKRRCRPRGARP
jgi:Na+/proline symporter